ncbi:hypothetical protein OHB12_14760 [Nocardia sp. NBC_01730]|uniref:hypothetical protein n=1 Tax=Nocardia sp. NBC_01730 TaxID=2975998 RepID=UPI002E0E21D3|nr:hypothetical protein OHB12_14760 [Nocardia sp. NBC_01730]
MSDLQCSRCGIDTGNFVGGLDPDEWYCATCAGDVPEIALSRSRAASTMTATQVLRVDQDQPPEPPVFPEFDHLLRVIAVGHRAVVDHVAVTVFSVELFTDGFRVQTRIELEPEHPEYVPGGSTPDYDNPDAPHGRMLHLESGFVIVDDLGGQYSCPSMLGGGVNRQEGSLHCAPAVDPGTTELWIRADKLLWQDLFRPQRGFFVDNGPWHFRVPLTER